MTSRLTTLVVGGSGEEPGSEGGTESVAALVDAEYSLKSSALCALR